MDRNQIKGQLTCEDVKSLVMIELLRNSHVCHSFCFKYDNPTMCIIEGSIRALDDQYCSILNPNRHIDVTVVYQNHEAHYKMMDTRDGVSTLIILLKQTSYWLGEGKSEEGKSK